MGIRSFRPLTLGTRQAAISDFKENHQNRTGKVPNLSQTQSNRGVIIAGRYQSSPGQAAINASTGLSIFVTQ
jgi:hypothetical protein